MYLRLSSISSYYFSRVIWGSAASASSSALSVASYLLAHLPAEAPVTKKYFLALVARRVDSGCLTTKYLSNYFLFIGSQSFFTFNSGPSNKLETCPRYQESTNIYEIWLIHFIIVLFNYIVKTESYVFSSVLSGFSCRVASWSFWSNKGGQTQLNPSENTLIGGYNVCPS